MFMGSTTNAPKSITEIRVLYREQAFCPAGFGWSPLARTGLNATYAASSGGSSACSISQMSWSISAIEDSNSSPMSKMMSK
jgi:hypothetical protein